MSNNSTNSQPTGVASPVVQPPTVTSASVVQAIQTAVSGLPGLVSLDKGGRAKTPKAPLGFEVLAHEALAAVTDHPEMKPGTVDLAALNANLQRAAELEPVRGELSRDLRKVEDSILVARGDAWQAMLVIYDVIRSQTRLQPELANLVAKMAAFLAKRAKGHAKGKGKKAKGSKGKSAKAGGLVGNPVAGPPVPEPAPAPDPASAKPASTPAVTTVTTTSTEPTQK